MVKVINGNSFPTRAHYLSSTVTCADWFVNVCILWLCAFERKGGVAGQKIDLNLAHTCQPYTNVHVCARLV